MDLGRSADINNLQSPFTSISPSPLPE